MRRQLKIQIQTLVICGLLLLSAVDISECRKTQTSNKKSKTGTQTVRPKTVSNVQHANPASFSYSGVQPNAPQPQRPSAPVQQPSYPSQSRPPYPVTNQQPVNNQAIGFNPNLYQQQRPQTAPYPVNSQTPYSPNNANRSPPYPTNNQQPSYPTNNQQPSYPTNNQAPYPTNNQQGGQFNSYPQQGHSNINPQPNYGQQQPNYAPQPNYGQQQPNYAPQQPNYAPQPQVVHHVIQPVQPIQQQASRGGPGILGTAAIGAAAGLGTAVLYNQFSKSDEPKQTVIIVNNTQPAAPAATPVSPAVAETPIQSQPVNNANPPPQYTQQQGYDPNSQYNQQYPPQQNYPQQQFPQQGYDPNQQQQFPPQSFDPALQQQQQIINQSQSVPPVITENQTEQSSVNTEAPKSDAEATTIKSDQTTISATEVLSTVSDLKTTVEKGITPPDSLNSRASETVELKDVPVNHQTSPQTQANNGKLHNNSSQLQYSFIMIALSVIYHFVPKFII